MLEKKKVWLCRIIAFTLLVHPITAYDLSEDELYGGDSNNRVELLAVRSKKWQQEQERSPSSNSNDRRQEQQQQQPQNLYPPDEPTNNNNGGEDYFASYDADYVNPPMSGGTGGSGGANFSSMAYGDGVASSPQQQQQVIFPNPAEMMAQSYGAKASGGDGGRMATDQGLQDVPDVLPEVDLPDDSLSDSDLRERDRIDSVQYVYFGGRSSSQGSQSGSSFGGGRWGCAMPVGALIGGCGLAFAAASLLRNKAFRNSKMFPIEMNVISCFMVTDALLIVGLGDTKSEIRCEITALLLHYLHLVCASWIFVYCYVISDNVTKGYIPNLRYNYMFAYGVPAVLVLFFYAISLESYETKDYCWMSLEKGMLLGFMLPSTVLILANTLFAMIGLKAISKKQQEAIAATIENYIQQTLASSDNNGLVDPSNAPNHSEKYVSTNSSLTSLDCIPHQHHHRHRNDDFRKSEMDLDDQGNYEGSSWAIGGGGSSGNFHRSDYTMKDSMKNLSYKIDLSSLSIDNLSWKTAEPEDMSDMRKCLNFALIMQPLFCVFWFMGVVALENSNEALPPFVFAFLWSHMHWFIFARFVYVLPFIPYEDHSTEVEEVNHVLQDSTVTVQSSYAKSTDTIPLLVTKVEVPRENNRDGVRPPDSISTISN